MKNFEEPVTCIMLIKEKEDATVHTYVPVHQHICSKSWPVTSQANYQLVGILDCLDQVSSSAE